MQARSRGLGLVLAAITAGLTALACASAPPAGPQRADEKPERHLITGSHIPREGTIPEHGLADAPFRAEVITRDEIRRSGAMTAVEALRRN